MGQARPSPVWLLDPWPALRDPSRQAGASCSAGQAAQIAGWPLPAPPAASLRVTRERSSSPVGALGQSPRGRAPSQQARDEACPGVDADATWAPLPPPPAPPPPPLLLCFLSPVFPHLASSALPPPRSTEGLRDPLTEAPGDPGHSSQGPGQQGPRASCSNPSKTAV